MRGGGKEEGKRRRGGMGRNEGVEGRVYFESVLMCQHNRAKRMQTRGLFHRWQAAHSGDSAAYPLSYPCHHIPARFCVSGKVPPILYRSFLLSWSNRKGTPVPLVPGLIWIREEFCRSVCQCLIPIYCLQKNPKLSVEEQGLRRCGLLSMKEGDILDACHLSS